MKKIFTDTTDRTFYYSNDYGLDYGIISDYQAPWITSLAFDDSINGVAVGQKSAITYTTNGGADWTNASQPVIADFNKVTHI